MTRPLRRTLNIDDPLAAHDTVPRSTHAAATNGRLREIALDEIHPNPNQPRRQFAPEALDALVGSIRERGVLQPIIVQPGEPDGYKLIAGERRWRASRLAGLNAIPALVDDPVDDSVALELALIENIAREDLTVIEEARAIASLLDDLAVSQTNLARRLGRSRSDLSHTIRLLELPDDTIDMINAGTLTKGHGKALLIEPGNPRRRSLARRAAASEWSVRELEAHISNPAKPNEAAVSADQVEAAATLGELLRRVTGSDARVRPHPQGYQLILDPNAAAALTRQLQASD